MEGIRCQRDTEIQRDRRFRFNEVEEKGEEKRVVMKRREVDLFWGKVQPGSREWVEVELVWYGKV